MGRKSIPPNQRAQPISFSLKPHLIEKIDDYASDLRFSRSKFLMEAVTQYILKADMGYMAASNNVNDMTLAQKVAVGLAALQEANREGETISKHVMDELRRELEVSDSSLVDDHVRRDIEIQTGGTTSPLDYHRTRAGHYRVFYEGERVATISKEGSKWILYASGKEVKFHSLAQAQSALEAGAF